MFKLNESSFNFNHFHYPNLEIQLIYLKKMFLFVSVLLQVYFELFVLF